MLESYVCVGKPEWKEKPQSDLWVLILVWFRGEVPEVLYCDRGVNLGMVKHSGPLQLDA